MVKQGWLKGHACQWWHLPIERPCMVLLMPLCKVLCQGNLQVGVHHSTTYQMQWSTSQWTWKCHNVGCALVMLNNNGWCSCYWLLIWYWQHRKRDIIGQWMNMMSGWLDFIHSIHLPSSWTTSFTSSSSSTNTMYIAVVGIMGIVVVGIASHAFSFQRNSMLAILDYMWSSLSYATSSPSNVNGSFGLSRPKFFPLSPPSLLLYKQP